MSGQPLEKEGVSTYLIDDGASRVTILKWKMLENVGKWETGREW